MSCTVLDQKVMGLNPGWVERGLHSPSVHVDLEPNISVGFIDQKKKEPSD